MIDIPENTDYTVLSPRQAASGSSLEIGGKSAENTADRSSTQPCSVSTRPEAAVRRAHLEGAGSAQTRS